MENELSAHFNDAKEWQMYRRMSKAAKNSHMFMYITFIHLEVRVPTLISFCRVFHALHPKFIVKIYSGLLSVPLYNSTTCNAGTRSEWTCMWKSDFSITYIIKLIEFVLAEKIDRLIEIVNATISHRKLFTHFSSYNLFRLFCCIFAPKRSQYSSWFYCCGLPWQRH